MKNIRFIDLFAGLGGTRIGFELACKELGFSSECVFTSEIKPYAVDIYKHNFFNDSVYGDITKINENSIPDFDFLLGGFPCQTFSTAGKKAGFEDTRGTVFFDVARIIKEKNPKGFLLENVEGLVSHDKKDKGDEIGSTLKTILSTLQSLGYKVTWKVLDAKNFGIPQVRKRIYIVGNKANKISLNNFKVKNKVFSDIQENNLAPVETDFTKKLLELFLPEDLGGKAIKDKRGGNNNIHSWDLELKGALSKEQKNIMSLLLRERRKKKWAEIKGIVWMDGMSLTLNEIHSFYSCLKIDDLKKLLDDMVEKKYLRYEHPKDLIISQNGIKKREYATHLEKGYNIVTGKLSFEFNKILGKKCIAPTIVATEADRIGVIDNKKIRRMSERECFRFFGFPESYNSNISHKNLYDLIGNTVVVPVIKLVSERMLSKTI
ncbi:DNA (cytosine-5-)-methyltransferase [Methylococcaceae bacterium CS1]|nr:DNA (cytosine-5-)-methyltransferase [Methylococcaceae bacterium CS4]TXK93851.1 DNA (cytosine-5-)-methyltransferase [Methylococcaceae bacterium CS5]TXL03267.1 DNA (cytosine-5-)-methyltransferase [Methylococcaceae bacterium CS1]